MEIPGIAPFRSRCHPTGTVASSPGLQDRGPERPGPDNIYAPFGTAGAFADCLIAADPNGVLCGKNDEQIRTRIPEGLAFHRSIGVKSMMALIKERRRRDSAKESGPGPAEKGYLPLPI